LLLKLLLLLVVVGDADDEDGVELILAVGCQTQQHWWCIGSEEFGSMHDVGGMSLHACMLDVQNNCTVHVA
jgi:hypothetical protein